MSEKSNDFTENFEENPAFSDTGSPKINNLDKAVGAASPKIEKSAGNGQFSPKTEKFALNTDESADKPAETSQPPLNSAVDCVIAPNKADFFNSENTQAFLRDFPSVDLNKLRESRNFQAFLGILHKNPTLSQVYACFNSIVSEAEENSQKKLLQAMANAKSSVGALSSSQESSSQYFTKDQVLKMTPKQIRANYSQIRISQEKW